MRRRSCARLTLYIEADTLYKVDTDAITTEVRREFAAKEKEKKATKPPAKMQSKPAKTAA